MVRVYSYSHYVHQLNDVASSQAFILAVGNKNFYSCDGMKNDLRHTVPMEEMGKTYWLVAENLNARDYPGDFCGGILLKVY
jgi:hypothetical protein